MISARAFSKVALLIPRQQPGVRRGCGGVRKLGAGRETPVAINLRPLGLQQKHQERVAENGDIPDLIAFVEERFLRPDQRPPTSLGFQRLNGLFLGLRKTRRVAFTFLPAIVLRARDAGYLAGLGNRAVHRVGVEHSLLPQGDPFTLGAAHTHVNVSKPSPLPCLSLP